MRSGATNRRIIVKHMLPNAIGPIIVNATLTVALSIILESTLSFLGLGVQPPNVSLGLLVGQGQDSATTEWWLFVFPVAFLIILILSIFLDRRRSARGVRPQEEPGEGLMPEPPCRSSASRSTSRPRTGWSTPYAAWTCPSSAGEVLGIVGESGSGKSVTALATMGLLPKGAKVRGSIRFDGTELLALKEKQLTNVRGTGISMIFQDPMTALNPVYTIGWQIVEAILAHQDMSKEAARPAPSSCWPRSASPTRRSGSTTTRTNSPAACASAPSSPSPWPTTPTVILADEPTTALDVTVQAQVLNSLKTAMAETGAALLLITHDLGVIAGLADRVLVMYAGRAGRDRDRRGRLLPALHAVHAGPARLAAAARRRRLGAAAPDPGLASLHARRPHGLPLRPPLPARHRPLPRNGARPAWSVPSVTSATGEHRAACHYAEAVGRGDHGQVFSDGVVDNVIA